MTIEQLERLAQNPAYKLSEKQIDILEQHRLRQYNRRKANNKPIKHATNFKRHNTDLEQEPTPNGS
jgi:hypothetical protein